MPETKNISVELQHFRLTEIHVSKANIIFVFHASIYLKERKTYFVIHVHFSRHANCLNLQTEAMFEMTRKRRS